MDGWMDYGLMNYEACMIRAEMLLGEREREEKGHAGMSRILNAMDISDGRCGQCVYN